MQAKHLNGPGAGVQKYDVLTALGTFALGADRSTQRRVLRLITLITARYNWRLNALSVGRRDIARLWSVDERTVKREIGALKALGLIGVKRPGARGRVTTYSVEIGAILTLSQPDWARVGPDFEDRMTAMATESAPERTVIPFPASVTEAGTEWADARRLLKDADTARDAAWFAQLQREGVEGTVLVLRAPSRFHAAYVTTHMTGEITRAVAQIAPRMTAVRILPPDG